MKNITELIRKEERLLKKILPDYDEIYNGTIGRYWFGWETARYDKMSQYSGTYQFDIFFLASLDCLAPIEKGSQWTINKELTQTYGIIEYLRRKSTKSNNKSLFLFGAKISREKAKVGFLPLHSINVTPIFSGKNSPKEIAEILNNLAIELCLEEGSNAGFMNAIKYLNDIIIYNKNEESRTKAYNRYNQLYTARKNGLDENLRRKLFAFDYHVSSFVDRERNANKLREKYQLKDKVESIPSSDLKEFTGPLPEWYVKEK